MTFEIIFWTCILMVLTLLVLYKFVVSIIHRKFEDMTFELGWWGLCVFAALVVDVITYGFFMNVGG